MIWNVSIDAEDMERLDRCRAGFGLIDSLR